MKNIILSICLMGAFTTAAVNVDSLHSELGNSLPDSTRMEILNILMDHYFQKKPPSAINIGKMGIDLALKTNKLEVAGDFAYNVSVNYYIMSFYDTSLIFANETIKHYQAGGNQKKVAKAHFIKAVNQTALNRFEDATSSHLAALNIYEKLGLTLKAGESCGQMSFLFFSQNDFEKGVEYGKKGVEMIEAVAKERPLERDVQALIDAYRITGKNLAELGQNQEALIFFNKAISTQKEHPFHPAALYVSILTRGEYYLNQQQDEAALADFDECRKLANQAGNKDYAVAIDYNIGLIYKRKGDYKTALRLMLKAVKFRSKNKRDNIFMNALYGTSEAYKGIADHKNALKYMEMGNKVRDSLYTLETEQISRDLIAKYETEKKENEILVLEKDQAVKAAQIQQSRTQTFYAIGGLLLLLALAAFLYYRYRYVNGLQKQLAQLNTNKDRLFAIISHDLRGSLSGFQNIGEILDFHIEKGNTEQIKTVSRQMDSTASSLNNLLDNLLQWSVSQMEGVRISPEKVAVQPVVDEITNLFKENATTKGIEMKTDIAPSLNAHADPNSLKLVLRNLVSNALKFSDSGDAISISGRQDGQFVELEVRDTGRGVPPEKMATVFQIDRKSSSQGTAGEQGVGLGLALCKEFVERNGGAIELESEEGKGTVCRFRLPMG